MTSTLYLIPTQLNDENIQVIPEYVKNIINTLDEFVVENEKSARHFLKRIGYKRTLNDIQLYLLNEHTDYTDVSNLLKPLLEGKNLGLLSEAGCPAVADPGAELVSAAHRNNISVVPLV